ncbi:MAG: Ig-like domain-containing protein [Thermoplasmatota archaeon]
MSGKGLFTKYKLPVNRRIISLLFILTLIAPLTVEFIPMSTSAVTISEGEYSGDNSWTDTSEPYFIDGNITIPEGSSLKISPGVTVDIKDGCWIDVQGYLEAAGTEESPVLFTNTMGGRWSQINVSSGGYAYFDHVNISVSSRGLKAENSNSTIRLYNSTIHDIDMVSLTALDKGVIWCINTSRPDVSVSVGGEARIHEGYWLRVRTLLNNGGGPFRGSKLNLKISYEYGPDKVAYNSIGNDEGSDPVSDSSGNFPLIAVERYFHNGSFSSFLVHIRIKLDADEESGLMRTWGKVDSHITLDDNLEYVWWMDNIPPPDMVNFTIEENGGIVGTGLWIRVGWEWDFDATEHQLLYFVLGYRKKIGGEWAEVTTDRMDRSYNFTGLEGSTIYEFKILALDNNGNPSNESDVLEAMTRDIIKPDKPGFIEIVVKDEVEQVGGTWAELKWDYSDSNDVAGYVLTQDDSPNAPAFMILEGRFNNQIMLENLASETTYRFWVMAYDSADPPNHSNLTGPVEFTTLDITAPVAPKLRLYLVDEVQYIEGSGIFNTTLVGLNVTVQGEDRTLLEILMNGEEYLNPNPDIKWSTYGGRFEWVMFVHEGSYNISVRSIDPSGNVGDYSHIEFLVDLTPCDMEIFGLEKGILTVDSGMDFNLRANVTDEIGVHIIKWYVTVEGEEQELSGRNVSMILDPGDYDARLVAVDKGGNVNVTDFIIRALVPDHIFPRVVSTTPAEGGTVTDLVPSIYIEFSEPLIWGLLSFDLAYVEDGTEISVPLNIEIDAENLSVDITVKQRLLGKTNYTLSIDSITDLRGNTAEEFLLHFMTIDELLLDSDGDGIPNSVEATYSFLDPYDPSDGALDQDKDGLNNSMEYALGTDMEDPDTDGDRMYDGWEYQHNLNPLLNTDATVDSDNDGFENWEEFLSDTDPWDPESKPDTSSDGDDFIIWVIAVVLALAALVIIAMVVLVIRKKGGSEEEKEEEMEDVPESPLVEEPEKMVSNECPQCGASFEEGMEFCPECGMIIPPSMDEEITDGMLTDPQMEDETESEGMEQVESTEDMRDEDMDIPDESDDILEPPSMDDAPRMDD